MIILHPDGTLSKLSKSLSVKDLINTFSYNPNDIYISKLETLDINKNPLILQSETILISQKTTKGFMDIENTAMVFTIIVTDKNGYPALWETSATSTNKEVILIANGNSKLLGRMKQAIYINQKNNEFKFQSALIPIDINDFIIVTRTSNYDKTYVYKIENINVEKKQAKCRTICFISDDPFETDLSYERAYLRYPYLKSVIKSSRRKIKKGETLDIHYAEYQHLINYK